MATDSGDLPGETAPLFMLHPCANCGKTILFGGVNVTGNRYCAAACAEQDAIGRAAVELPADVVGRAMQEILEGACPVCAGPGPVDVFASYRVTSMIAVTSWKSIPRVSCRSCATKAQLQSAAYSLALGWWGFPWGVLITPVQIARNLIGLTREANPREPSPLLEAVVREQIAATGTQLGALRRTA